ncbi:hypothetical protein I8F73_03385 [Enterococcus faecalis]|nr:hypothetical protein [Enterococcus faecalis]
MGKGAGEESVNLMAIAGKTSSFIQVDQERQKEWLKDNSGQWHGNVYWKQHCDCSLNRRHLFVSD